MSPNAELAELRDLLKQQQELIVDLQSHLMDRELDELSHKVRKRPLVLFFGRSTFSDNTKYLFLEAVNSASDYDVQWCTWSETLAAQLRAHDLPCLLLGDDQAVTIRELLQCSVAVFCENMLSAFIANPALAGALAGAQKIQLWHGISVKHLDLMMIPFANVGEHAFRRSLKLASRPDMFLSTASCLDSFWAMAFGSTQLIRAGQPRNAVIVREATPQERIGADLPPAQADAMHDPAVRRVLVTPTWKRGQGLFTSSPEFHRRLATWAARRNAVVFVKPHPFMTAAERPANVPGRLYALDAGTDIYPWLSRFDALITDYSSIMFDFLFTGKPIFTFDASTQVSYEFEPDWSLIPDTPFRYEFTADNLEQVLDASIDAHPLASSQRELCSQLYETDPLDASAQLLRVIDECNAIACNKPVNVIEMDIDEALAS